MSYIDIPIYPLEQVLEVKRKRVEKSAKILAEKKRLLEIEEEKLAEAIEKKEQVEKHKIEKVSQLRDIMDHQTTTDKIQNARDYLDVVNTKLQLEIEKVKKQERQVNIAQVAFDNAKKIWEKMRKEVEKIEKHRDEWIKQATLEAERNEEKISDEIGTIVFLGQRIQNGP